MEEAIEPSVTEETQETTGLLDNATPEAEEVNQDTSRVEIDHRDPAELQAKADFEAEQDGESTEKPDWLPENFWKSDDAEADYEAMAKSWSDLRKQISQGKHKAPKDGNYDLSAFGNTPEDDPVREHVVGWAKEYGVSQAALDKLVGQVVDMNQTQAQNYSANLEQERKALGPNADARINGMVKWASNLVQKGVWGNDDFEEFKIMGGTAKGLSALEKIRSSYEGRIPVESVPVEGAPSKEELYQMVGDPRYQTDPAYRAKVEKAFAQNFGS
mgnify:CR=1 FL=1|tara:strand:+ start:4783 stop:5598 length:816 start_codon:yes stop_codon:yes gene_type:complete